MNTLFLDRFAYAPDGTFGTLSFPTGEVFYTAECPWIGNRPNVSCIPEGIYALGKRHSPIVKKSSGNMFSEGWELLNVPNRELIMIHPANFPTLDLKGCIAVGENYQIIPDRTGVARNAVTRSKPAFRKVMELLEVSDYWDLIINQTRIEYP